MLTHENGRVDAKLAALLKCGGHQELQQVYFDGTHHGFWQLMGTEQHDSFSPNMDLIICDDTPSVNGDPDKPVNEEALPTDFSAVASCHRFVSALA